MQKLLATALASAFVAITVTIGCGSSSSDNGGLPPRQPPNDTETVLDAGESTPTCDNHAKVDDRPECDTCTRAKCCEQILACDDAPDCTAIMECIGECASDDIACILTCNIAHEKGAGILNDVGSCARTKCKTECPSAVPDGGDLDPF